MDKLKQIPHIKVDATVDYNLNYFSRDFNHKAMLYIRECQKKEDDFFITLLNRHGVPITSENVYEYVDIIRIDSIPCDEFGVDKKRIFYKGKPLCEYERITKNYTYENGETHIRQTLKEIE